jgi:hypothetical protein
VKAYKELWFGSSNNKKKSWIYYYGTSIKTNKHFDWMMEQQPWLFYVCSSISFSLFLCLMSVFRAR